jgi:hypothetical protein
MVFYLGKVHVGVFGCETNTNGNKSIDTCNHTYIENVVVETGPWIWDGP